MTKLSIICAETYLVENKGNGTNTPSIVLLGRNEECKRVKFRVPYYPYFYLVEEDYINLEHNNSLKTFHIVKVLGTKARNLVKRVMTKIIVQDAGRIGENIKAINKMNKQQIEKEETLFTYEADLSRADLLPLRWLIDHGVKCGVDIEKDDKGEYTFTPIDFYQPLRKWYIDFEAYSFRMAGLDSSDPINMCSVWDTYEKKLYIFYTTNPKWSVNQIDIFNKRKKEIIDNNKVYPLEVREYKTEANLLDGLVELTILKDWDVLVAWNLNRYDIEKWKYRMEVNRKQCVHKFSDISPLKQILWNNKPHRVKGRILFDLMVAFRQFTDAELDSYSLANVIEKEHLPIAKIPFKGSSGNTWDIAPEVLFERNINDVLVIKALDEKYELVETYNDSRIEFGCLFHETFVRHRVIDTALMRLVNGKVILRSNSLARTEGEEKLLGAVVKEPIPDEYLNVAQLDFGREYPSIIKGFNISPETYREKEPIEDHYTVEYTHNENILKFYFIKSPRGLLPQLILHFDKLRDYYQQQHKKAIEEKQDESIVKMWERRQYNAKKTTNAIYGVMDYSGFRLNKKECTQATAIIGRISIEELTKFLESIGYTLLYGDTDSIFILLKEKDKDKLLIEGQELQKKLNEHLTTFFTEKYGVEKAPAELGFKKVYSRILFIGKKNYAGKGIWDEKKGWFEDLDIKGIGSVRSDNSMLEKTVIETLLKMILNEEQENIIKSYIRRMITDFDNRKFGIIEISYPQQIKKVIRYDPKKECWVTDYAALDKRGVIKFASHARSAIYSNMYLNTNYQVEDKPRRLCIKFPKKVKVSKEQQTLFKEEQTPYPTEWIYKGRTGGITKDITVPVKDISIVEDMDIPEFFTKFIDYERIRVRLVNKIQSILDIHNKNIYKCQEPNTIKESEKL